MSDKFLEEVKQRRAELIDEFGNSDVEEIRINEILRDEFNDESYDDALISVGVNLEDDDLGLDEVEEEDDFTSPHDSDTKDALLKVMVNPSEHIKNTELRYKGFEPMNGKMVKKKRYLIPRDEITFVIQTLETLYLPQSLVSKLKKDIADFDDYFNSTVDSFRTRLEDYSEKIVPPQNLQIAVNMLLSEIVIIRNAIISGRLGDITRDMVINSYNEKQDSSTDTKVKDLKKKVMG